MVREEILDNGKRRYVLTAGPGIPEQDVSEERYLGWVMFRARHLEAIADPYLRARCARYEAALGRSSTSRRPTEGRRTIRWGFRPGERYSGGPIAQLVRAAGRYASRRMHQTRALPHGARQSSRTPSPNRT